MSLNPLSSLCFVSGDRSIDGAIAGKDNSWDWNTLLNHSLLLENIKYKDLSVI